MKTRNYIIALLSVMTLAANAQTFKVSNPAVQQPLQTQQTMESQRIMSGGTNYNGTVYTPFDNTVPSEQSTVGSTYSPGTTGKARRSDSDPWGSNQDGGHTEDESSPIGEPWVLAGMALLFGAVIYLRRARRIKKS